MRSLIDENYNFHIFELYKPEMLTCIIIDDDFNSRKILRSMIDAKFPSLKVIYTAKNLNEAIEKHDELAPDVVFLDVELGENETGFNFLERITHRDFKLVFTTAFDSYAIKAFKVNATDYLLKPFSPEELGETVKKIFSQPSYNTIQPEIDSLISYVNGNREQIAIPMQNGYEFIKIADIIRIEAQGNYTQFYMKDNRTLMVSKTLKTYDELLSSEGFCRVHAAHLINVKEVKKYYKGEGGYVILSNQHRVDISRSRKDFFLEKVFSA